MNPQRIKAVLNHDGIEAETPRQAIKEAFRAKIIREGEGWIDMLEDRNKTSHIYNEKEALIIYRKIKEQHFPLLKEYLAKMGGRGGEEEKRGW